MKKIDPYIILLFFILYNRNFLSMSVPTYDHFNQIVSMRQYDQLRDLISSKKVPVDYRKDSTTYTALMMVCSRCGYWDSTGQLGGNGYDARMIKFLLDNGANPNACSFYPQTGNIDFCSLPLSLVLFRAHHGDSCETALEIVKMLLEKGARPNPYYHLKSTRGSEFGINIAQCNEYHTYHQDDHYLANLVNNYENSNTLPIAKELLRHGCRTDTHHNGNGRKTARQVLTDIQNRTKELYKYDQYKSSKERLETLIRLLDDGLIKFEQTEMINLEQQRLIELEKEKQRLAEIEKQRLINLENQRLAKLEQERLAELDRRRFTELEKQRLIELENQRLTNLARAELERQQMIELEKLRELEKQRLANLAIAELEQQRLAELERQKSEYEKIISQRMKSNPLFKGFSYSFKE